MWARNGGGADAATRELSVNLGRLRSMSSSLFQDQKRRQPCEETGLSVSRSGFVLDPSGSAELLCSPGSGLRSAQRSRAFESPEAPGTNLRDAVTPQCPNSGGTRRLSFFP